MVRWLVSSGALAALLMGNVLPDATRHPAAVIAIEHVTVIDVIGGIGLADQTVLIDHDSILATGPSAGLRAPAGAQRVDGRGKYLIPGLWDMHVHLGAAGPTALDLLVANGVTGARDMGGSQREVFAWRDSIAAGLRFGPRLKAAGRVVEAAAWVDAVRRRITGQGMDDVDADLASRHRLDDSASAAAIVDTIAAEGADFIKIRNYPSPEVYAVFAAAAARHGLRIVGHSPQDLRYLGRVVEAGFGSIEHGVLAFRDGGPVGAFDAIDSTLRARVFARYADRGTAFDPTLVAMHARFVPDSVVRRLLAGDPVPDVAAVRYVAPALRRHWRESAALAGQEPALDWGPALRSTLRDIAEMRAAGIRILAGTDLGVTTLVPGFALHDELELLVGEAGLAPIDALRAATVNAAAVLGLPRLGRIAPSALADLVLLDGDPLRDVAATRRIAAVVANGRWLDRAALDRLLRDAEAIAGQEAERP